MSRLVSDYLPIILLAIGVALSAAGGARLGQMDLDAVRYDGQLTLGAVMDDGGADHREIDPGIRFTDWFDTSGVVFITGLTSLAEWRSSWPAR